MMLRIDNCMRRWPNHQFLSQCTRSFPFCRSQFFAKACSKIEIPESADDDNVPGNPFGGLQEFTQKKLLRPPIYEFVSEQGLSRIDLSPAVWFFRFIVFVRYTLFSYKRHVYKRLSLDFHQKLRTN